ncbi:MAG TPA: hypothetical protein VK138_13555 [Acidiferrobacterales bacterium]|nr:hypothetical protein [Acidiferrobacterales bacterium]
MKFCGLHELKRIAIIMSMAVLLASGQNVYSAPPSNKKISTNNQEIPFKKGSDISSSQITRLVGIFIVVVLLAAGTVYLLKRYITGIEMGKNGIRRRIRLLESKRLTPRTILFLVEIDGKTYMLSQHGEKLLLVDSISSDQNKLESAN